MIQLITNAGTIDLPRDSVVFDFAITDLREVNNSKADASRTFSLPATRGVLRAMGYQDLLELNPDSQQVKIAARLEVDGFTIANGWLRVVQITGDMIDVVMLSGSGSLIGELEDKPLTDIDYTDEQHTYNAASILASYANYDSRPYIYPLVDFGQPAGSWLTKEIRMAVKVKDVVERMIKAAGWTLSSTFMASDYFSRLYLFGGNLRDLPTTVTDPRQHEAVTSADLAWTVDNGPLYPVFNTAVTASANYSTTTGRYTFDYALKARFTATVGLQYDGGANQADVMGALLRVKLNRGGVVSTIGEAAVDIPVAFNSVSAQPFAVTVMAESEFKSGDVAYIELDGNCNDTLRQYQVTAGASYLSHVFPQALPGAPVNPGMFLPDTTQLELLQALRHKFNLQICAVPGSRTVYIEPFDDFYGLPSAAVNWSAKVNRAERPVITSQEPREKRLIMGWATDSDYNVERLAGDLPYGAGSYTFSTPGARGESEDNCTVFAATFTDICPRKWMNSIKIPVCWMSEPDEQTGLPDEDYDIEPRLLYFQGMQAHAWFLDYQQQTSAPVFLTETMDSLMNRYYRRSLYMIDKAHKVSYQMVLSSMDILGLDPRKLIRVDQSVYFLSEISGWSATGDCDVELMQWKAKGEAQGATITGNTIPPPHGKVKPRVGVYVLDTRFRPPQVLPVLVEDDNGNLTQVEVDR